MNRYVVSDVGMGAVFVYPTTTEEQKYYVYEDWKSEDLSHSEFLDSVFEPKGNKIVKSARVVEKNADDSSMWCRSAEHFGGESSCIFDLNDYVAVEVDFFLGEKTMREKAFIVILRIFTIFLEKTFIEKNGLVTKVNERISNIDARKDKIEEEISDIRCTAGRYNQVMNVANEIIDGYFNGDGEILDSSLDAITPEDFARYVEYDNSNVCKKVAEQWKTTRFIDRFNMFNTAAGFLGGTIANIYLCATSEETTFIPLLLGCRYALAIHYLLDVVRMQLAGSKGGKIVEDFSQKVNAKT